MLKHLTAYFISKRSKRKIYVYLSISEWGTFSGHNNKIEILSCLVNGEDLNEDSLEDGYDKDDDNGAKPESPFFSRPPTAQHLYTSRYGAIYTRQVSFMARGLNTMPYNIEKGWKRRANVPRKTRRSGKRGRERRERARETGVSRKSRKRRVIKAIPMPPPTSGPLGSYDSLGNGRESRLHGSEIPRVSRQYTYTHSDAISLYLSLSLSLFSSLEDELFKISN